MAFATCTLIQNGSWQVTARKSSGQRCSCNLPTHGVEEIFTKSLLRCDDRVKSQSTQSVNPPKKRTPSGQENTWENLPFCCHKKNAESVSGLDHVHTDVNNRKKGASTTCFPPKITLSYQSINLGADEHVQPQGATLGSAALERPRGSFRRVSCSSATSNAPPWEVIIELALGRRACFSSPSLRCGGRSSNRGEHKGFVQEGEGKQCSQSTDYCTAVVVYFD